MVSGSFIFVITVHILGFIAVLGSGVLSYIKNQKKPLNRVFFFSMMIVALYEAEFILTPLMPNERFAYYVGFLSLFIVFIPVLFSQLLFMVSNTYEKYRWYVWTILILALAIVGASVSNPLLFLEAVEPRLYFPWWLVPGPLFSIASVFFLLALLFPFIIASQARNNLTKLERRRLNYFLTFLGISLPLGSLNFLLTFGIQFGPLLAAFWTFGMIPIMYGIISDNLLEVQTIIKQSFFYSVSVASLAALLALLISLNNVIVNAFPWVQFWTIPIFTAVVAFSIGRLFWQKLLENDRIKYEFITVATHKLRTPLTQISWSVRTLLESNLTPEVRATAEHIQKSSNRLIELTNILFETTEESTQSYAYEKTPVPLLETTRTVLSRLDPFIQAKQLTVNIHADDEVVVQGDSRRLGSVIEVLLENAINYSSRGGLIQIIAYVKGSRAYYSVRDHGIGVSPEDQKRIFTRFYRTDAARRADTEGVGLGLAMAKSIIEKHQGTIGVESSGDGTGSVFWFKVPFKARKDI